MVWCWWLGSVGRAQVISYPASSLVLSQDLSTPIDLKLFFFMVTWLWGQFQVGREIRWAGFVRGNRGLRLFIQTDRIQLALLPFEDSWRVLLTPSWVVSLRVVVLHGFGTVLREILSRGTPRPIIVFPPERPVVPRRLFSFALLEQLPMKVTPFGRSPRFRDRSPRENLPPSVGRCPCRNSSADIHGSLD